jgi:hypothetical protein
MRGLPKTQQSAVKRTYWALGCGGAGSLSTLAMMHGLGAPGAIAAGAVAAVVSNAIAELSGALPTIIAALSAKRVARIRAKTDAQVALERARRRTMLVSAALEGKLDAALSLLKLQMLAAQVRARPRLSENMLRELLPDPRSPHERDSKLAVIQPRRPGTTARHAKDTTQPTSPSLPIDAQSIQLGARAAEHL